MSTTVYTDLVGPLAAHLADRLGVPVVGQTPSPRPPTWLLIEHTGGTASIATAFPMLTVEANAPTKESAADLAGRAWDEIIRRLPPVVGTLRVTRRVPVSAPSYQPRPSAGDYRYRMTVQVKHQVIPDH